MSSTRYAPQSSPVSYERYMSSPEFVKLRGIPGTAVAAKAQLYSDARKRSLLFFLQSLSINEGGLQEVARGLLQKFPTFSEEHLADLLVEVCINPKIVIRFSDESPARQSPALLPNIKVADEVRKYQDRYEANIKGNFVLTTIANEIFETLDYALAIGNMVVIEGESGIGKTTAAKAWFAAHQGEARLISLSGVSHKTGFFRKLATAIGLSAAKGKAVDMQVRVEDFFRKTRLMLVIDEAHYLWPQYQRSYSSPELIDWVNTALINQNVPIALICTDQFAKLKTRVEKQIGWTSEQLEHRIKRYKRLRETPSKQDLEVVATKLLASRWNSEEQKWTIPGTAADPDFIRLVVGYALTCKMKLAAVAKTVEEARYQARKARRSHIVATDIRTALLDYQIPSDQALQNAWDSPPHHVVKTRATVRIRTAGLLQSTGVASPVM